MEMYEYSSSSKSKLQNIGEYPQVEELIRQDPWIVIANKECFVYDTYGLVRYFIQLPKDSNLSHNTIPKL